MSAEVVIMNSLGVAVAADSSVTIQAGGKNKVNYTQDKIFGLSPKHPVGIMIYDEFDFMGINWEILLNEYRKDIGDSVFDTLEEYALNLLEFLRNCTYVTEARQEKFLENICNLFFSGLKSVYDTEISSCVNREINPVQKNRLLQSSLEIMLGKKRYSSLPDDYYKFPETDYIYVFEKREIVQNIMQNTFCDFAITDNIKNDIFKSFLSYINSYGFYVGGKYSGIVVAGYGNNDLSPSIVQMEIFGRLGNTVLCGYFETKKINKTQAYIIPFCQSAVTIDTFVNGRDPIYEFGWFSSFAEEFAGIFGEKYITDAEKLVNMAEKNIVNYGKKQFSERILDIVKFLPKTNLAIMAEALVNLTVLQRHISTRQIYNDYKNAGGPTDVALITKTDGFVWVKRK